MRKTFSAMTLEEEYYLRGSFLLSPGPLVILIAFVEAAHLIK